MVKKMQIFVLSLVSIFWLLTSAVAASKSERIFLNVSDSLIYIVLVDFKFMEYIQSGAYVYI